MQGNPSALLNIIVLQTEFALYADDFCIARHPTVIGGKRYRHPLKFEYQQDLEWYMLPGTKGPRLGFR